MRVLQLCTNGAPKASNMIARGKCERSKCVAPGNEIKIYSSPDKGVIRCRLFRPFRPQPSLMSFSRGDALRACPWLLYFAPSALSLSLMSFSRGDALRACPWLLYVAPSALSLSLMSFSRGDASRLPLAIICRAFGAQSFFDVLFQGRRA